MTTYEPPEWALNGTNSHDMSLEVIKSGIILEKIALTTKSFFVLGRMEPLCDLVLAHPSVSRTHAVLQFDRNGQLFLHDLSSTHGTFVNKKRIAAGEYIKVNVGDVLVFGESTRIYTILGPQALMPDEYDSANLDRIRHKLEERKRRAKEKEDEGVTWGFREDAVEDSDDDDNDNDQGATTQSSTRTGVKLPDYLRNRKDDHATPYVTSVTKDTVNLDKDAKLYTRLQARIQKMENLKAESSKIRAKQNVGLTDGQQAALDRNETRIAQLEEEIETLEAQLMAKHTQRTSQREAVVVKAKAKAKYEDESDDDDFYDRTKSNKATPAATKPKVLTMQSISATLSNLRDELARTQVVLEQVDQATASAASAADEADSLEAYMQQAKQSLAAQDRAKATAELARLTQLIEEQERLLEIATPAWAKIKAVEASTETTSSAHDQAAEDETAKASPVTAAADRPCQPVTVVFGNDDNDEPVSSALIVPTIEEMRAMERAEQDAATREKRPAADGQVDAEVKPKRIRRKKEPKGAAAPPSSSSTTKVYDTDVLEGGDVVWEPPKNQSGDGRTALNDKYGY
ncbi:Aste57867_24363 [Aphanomyces stellatus]|uniref:Aste57867_24363 protein n=1 Tax=Aphanomyces stellatus TaxID=120398 RepID=A0A485LQZ0_9STRA|nr:hypothetical protein As57867_024287 [Aphanomyces stellatus]VFU01003.1 Aste57867_24363 [Aphanomyces stellatus]